MEWRFDKERNVLLNRSAGNGLKYQSLHNRIEIQEHAYSKKSLTLWLPRNDTDRSQLVASVVTANEKHSLNVTA